MHPVKKSGSSLGIISRCLKMPNSAVQVIIHNSDWRRVLVQNVWNDSRTEVDSLVKMLLKLVNQLHDPQKKSLLHLIQRSPVRSHDNARLSFLSLQDKKYIFSLKTFKMRAKICNLHRW
uniref:Uncharacterized protein n=1 Tax=Xiphophorus maculatus TaxID=8083 RepID=A0A3B5RAY9_XIPMA